MFQKICEVYTLDELLSITDITKLTSIKGIKDTTASKILDGLQENLDAIKLLRENLIITDGNKNKNILGSIVFTNVRNTKFEEHLVSIGYEISESVNKKTVYVITDSTETMTGKIKKANDLGIPVMDITSAYKKFNY